MTGRPQKLAFNVGELAEAIGLSAEDVVALIDAGDLRARRIAGRWIIPADAVDQLLHPERHANEPSAPPDPDELLSIKEARSILGISRATFWHYTRKYPHEFRTFLSGKRRVMRRTDLEDWIQFRKEEDRG